MQDKRALAALEQVAFKAGALPPTPEQAAVAVFPPTPLLVVAGAGSGKTETLSLRAAFLSSYYGISPENILGLTFTRKAAAELEERLRQRLKPWCGDHALAPSPEAATYNGFALSVVREFGPLVGLDSQTAHMGDAAAWQLMSEVVALWGSSLESMIGDAPGSDTSMGTVVDKALALRQDITNQAMSLDAARADLMALEGRFQEAQDTPGRRPYIKFHRDGATKIAQRLELLDVIEQFERRKAALGAMDYADQVSAAYKIVSESRQAREALRKRYQVVFLDEFQDTSVAQMQFLSALFADHAVTAVGDPNQAIYGWRGASAASLDEFHPMFGGSLDATLTLSTAWRNDKAILESANLVAKPLLEPPSWSDSVAKDLEIGQSPLRKAKAAPPQRLAELAARKGAGPGRLTVRYRQFQDQEFQDLVEFVRGVHDSTDQPPTCAVLARSGSMLMRALEALRAAGIPAQLASGDALLAHPAVIDLRAALEVTCDVGRSSSLARLLTNLDLGVRDLDAMSKFAFQLGGRAALMIEVVDAVGDGVEVPGLSEAGQKRVELLAKRLRSMRSGLDLSVVDQVENARSVFALDVDAMVDPTSAGNVEVLQHFTQLAADYQKEATRPTMQAFLQWIDALEERERGVRTPSISVDPTVVSLMTVHSAKGLEWDAVAVVGLNHGAFPTASGQHKRAGTVGEPLAPEGPAPQSAWWTDPGTLPYPMRADAAHLPQADVWDMSVKSGSKLQAAFRAQAGEYLEREERRLAYVAVTRARHHLFLSGSWNKGTKSVHLPSTFLVEAANAADSAILENAPEPEQIDEALRAGAQHRFPPKVGPSRIAAEQVAAVVQAAKEAQLRDSMSAERALAGVKNQTLAKVAAGLLAEQNEEGLADMTPDEALAAVAETRALAVTEIARFAADPEGQAREWLTPVPAQPRKRALLGSVFHAWIEQHLGTLGAESVEPDQAEGSHLLRSGYESLRDSLPASEQESFDALRRAFLRSEWANPSEVVALEAPFWGPRADVSVRGRLDAVLRDSHGNYQLIDWKTRASEPRELSDEQKRYYASQLSQYRDAWLPRAEAESLAVDPMLVFIWPGGTRAVRLDQLQ